MTCCAPSTYSDEYSGASVATHSPQPSASGVAARTRRMSRSVCGAERRAERRDQRQLDAPQLDAGELHPPARVSVYQPSRVIEWAT